MSDVTVTINRRSYQIACDDGEEDHLRRLASIVDQRVEELVDAMGQIGDQRLVVMASLLLADEVAELRGAIERLEGRLRTLEANTPREVTEADSLMTLADRLERIAESMELA
jgi:cell division protein ZapA